MASAVVAPALRADAARNRALVLAAALRLLGERGLEVTMQEIADEAGVGVGTVFRRFATKDDLVAAVVEDRVQAMLALVGTALERSVDDPWSAFAECFTAIAELHVRHRGVMESLEGSRYCVPIDEQVRLELQAMVGDLVGRTIAAGELRPDVQVQDVPALVCAISRTSGSAGGADDPDTWRRACTFVLDGLRAGSRLR